MHEYVADERGLCAVCRRPPFLCEGDDQRSIDDELRATPPAPPRAIPRTWEDAALDAVIAVATRLDEFTSDDVWELLAQRSVPPPEERRALGPVLTTAKEHGWIASTDRTMTSRGAANHGRPVRVWRSHLAAAYRAEVSINDDELDELGKELHR